MKAVVHHKFKLSILYPPGDKNGLVPGLLTLAGFHRILQQVSKKTAQIHSREIQLGRELQPCPELYVAGLCKIAVILHQCVQLNIVGKAADACALINLRDTPDIVFQLPTASFPGECHQGAEVVAEVMLP